MGTDVLHDERKPGWYMIDNEIIDVYGARMGPYGIAVYNVIARHAGKSGGSFPSYKTIADKVGIGRAKAVQTVTLLINLGLLKKTARTDMAGDATSNHYTLVDVKSLKNDGEVVSNEYHLVSTENHPSIPPIPQVVSHVDTKKTIVEEDKVKEVEPPNVDKPKAQKRSATQARRTSSDESKSQPGGEVKKPTEHQLMFEKVCEIVGFDYKAIDDKCKAQVAQTVGILKEATYTLEDLNKFGREIWVKDWRWEKHKQHPTLTQLRQEIGKLRAKNFQASGTGSATWSKAFDESGVPDYIKQMQAGK